MDAAVKGRQIGCIRILCRRGASVTSIYKALKQAINNKDATIIRVLCELGANVSVKLVGKAISKNDIFTVDILCDSLTDINAKSKDGSTVLLIAASICNNIDIFLSILDRKADIHVKNNEGFTPLLAAAAGNCKKTSKEIVRILLQRNADANAINDVGVTPL